MEAETQYWEQRCSQVETAGPPVPTGQITAWTPEEVEFVTAFKERERIEKENAGLDIANTEGILPGGGMILPEDPTPNQAAYMERRLRLIYFREHEENLRLGNGKKIKFRPIRTGDLIP